MSAITAAASSRNYSGAVRHNFYRYYRRYMHENPVRRGLVASPELWRWSSYRAYFCGETGPVAVNKWEVLKLKRRAPAA